MTTPVGLKQQSAEDTIHIFVSYSHDDIQWAIRGDEPGHAGIKNTLIPWLHEQLKHDNVDIWCDPRLTETPHKDFEIKILQEIASADIALLLISEEFANSKFIQTKELPPIKQRHENGEIAILSILIGPISKHGRQKISWLFRPTVLPNDVQPLLSFLKDEAEFRTKRVEILEAIRNTIEYIQAERMAATEEQQESDAGERESVTDQLAAEQQQQEEARVAAEAERVEQERIRQEKEAAETLARQNEERREQELWDRATKTDSETSYATYLAESALLSHQEAAHTRAGELQAIRVHQEKEAAETLARRNEARREQELWDRAKKTDSEKSYATYLAESVLHKHTKPAQNRMAALRTERLRKRRAAAEERARQKEERREQELWAYADETDTEDSYATYLAESVLLTHQEAAHNRVSELLELPPLQKAENRVAKATRRVELLEDRLRQLDEEIEQLEWKDAAETDTENSYAKYLEESTQLTHKEAAETRVKELQAIRVRKEEKAADSSSDEVLFSIFAEDEVAKDTDDEQPVDFSAELLDEIYPFSDQQVTHNETASATDAAATLCSTSGPDPRELNLEWVTIPAGEFLFGDAKERRRTAEFLIMRYPVTVEQYRKFCQATGRAMPGEPEWGWQGSHPMVNVDCNDAAAFADWAGMKLPTVEEWEKAARGTDGRNYPWGNEWDAAKCHCSKQEIGDAKGTAPVGSFRTGESPYGVEDMAGNVWEWCDSWYNQENNERLVCGGCWFVNLPEYFRAAGRYYRNPSHRGTNYGFRCVFRSPEPRAVPRVGRNDACPCGSGKKYKKCCGENLI